MYKIIIIILITLGLFFLYQTYPTHYENFTEESLKETIYNVLVKTIKPVPSVPSVPFVLPVAQMHTQTNYKKLEEIINPSNLAPYVSRDQVCYREHNTPGYSQKRGGCMACQVDGTTNYEGTNVVSSCVYTLDPNNTDKAIWTKDKCVQECSKLN